MGSAYAAHNMGSFDFLLLLGLKSMASVACTFSNNSCGIYYGFAKSSVYVRENSVSKRSLPKTL